MKPLRTLALPLSTLALMALSGCSSSSDPAATSASTTTTTTTTGSGGAGGGSTTGTGGANAGGAGGGGEGGAAPACTQLGGAYVGKGTCDSPTYSFPPALCVRQTGCDVDIHIATAIHYAGSVTGDDFTATTTKPVPITCEGTMSGGSGTMSCSGAGITCEGSVEPVSVKDDVTSLCCDVVAQDCAAGERCQIVGSTATPLYGGCIADDGQVAVGEPCQRASDDALDLGHDDCVKGAFCSRTGQVDGVRVCRALCTADGQCGDGSACFDAGTLPSGGICLGTCAMFTEGACPAGATCRGSASLDGTSWHMNARCDVTGAKAAGDACASFQECGDGLGCFSGVCAAYCDKDHACPEGKTCAAFPGAKAPSLDASLGSCK